MARLLTTSLELLAVSSSRLLGAEILTIVEKMKNDYTQGFMDASDLKRICEVITKHTNMKLTGNIVLMPVINAAALTYHLQGHQGITGKYGSRQVIAFGGKPFDDILHTVHIDLENATVTGPLVDELQFELELCSGLFGGANVELTPEEITALVLHEVGHMFSVFMTFGDYIYLNYLLSEGIEVLLGKKTNRYKLEVLNTTYLAKLVDDPELAKRLANSPTEEDIRRAVLTSHRLMPRHHLSSADSYSSMKRSEQLADLFASRMGFGRPAATCLDKVNRASGGRYLRSRSGFIFVELAKLLTGVAAMAVFPILPHVSGLYALGLIAAGFSDTDGLHDSPYDNDAERIIKIRKDLVAQFKQFEKEPSMRAKLDADIKVIDKLLADYNQHRTLFEYVMQMFSSDRRRRHQVHKQEETLEKLLNNDLFLQAYRISQTAPKEA